MVRIWDGGFDVVGDFEYERGLCNICFKIVVFKFGCIMELFRDVFKILGYIFRDLLFEILV